MHNYHKNNLVEYYKQMILLCTVIIVLSTALTVYLVAKGFARTRQAVTSTYVYSPNGASIHIYSKESNLWKTY